MKRAAILNASNALPMLAVSLLLLLSACGQHAVQNYAVDGVARQQNAATQVRISSDHQPSPEEPLMGAALPEPTPEDEIQALLGAMRPPAPSILAPEGAPAPLDTRLELPLSCAPSSPDSWEPGLHDRYQALGNLLAEHPGLQVTITAHDPAGLAQAQLGAEAVKQGLVERFGLAPQRIIAMGYGHAEPSGPGVSIAVSGMLRPAQELSQGTEPEARAGGTGETAVLRFASGETFLQPVSREELRILVQALESSPTSALRIEGHTDDTGSREANRLLSKERAEAVKQLLVTQYGVAPDRLFTIGYGEERPVADNGSEQGRALNRRVEVALAPDAMLPALAAGGSYEIEVSVSQCRLWLYARQADGGRSLVRAFDVATARPGVEYPQGQGFVTGIDLNPWWYPTASMISRAERQGRTLAPTPPGAASNPMGSFKIHLSHGGAAGAFRIHGTNRPADIGRRVSLGCIRMHNDEGLRLARLISVGTPVTVSP